MKKIFILGTLALVVFVAAAFSFKTVDPGAILILAVGAILSISASVLSALYTHVAIKALGEVTSPLERLATTVPPPA